MNRTELAAQIGCTEGAVRFWEDGAREPRTKYLRRIAQVTGREVAWFFEGVR